MDKLFGCTFTYNEEKMIPYVMPYVEKLGYDKFVVYDNESTDNTVELLKKYPFVEIRTYQTNEKEKFGDIKRTEIMSEFYSECWKYICENNFPTVWLTITDFDEVLFTTSREGFRTYLNLVDIAKYNVYDGCMIELLNKNNVESKIDGNTLYHSLDGTRGVYWEVLGEKPLLFKLNDFSYMEFFGGHHFFRTKLDNNKEIKSMRDLKGLYSFHLKYVNYDYTNEKVKRYIVEKNNTGYSTYDNKYYFNNYLYPLSLPINELLLFECSKRKSLQGGITDINKNDKEFYYFFN